MEFFLNPHKQKTTVNFWEENLSHKSGKIKKVRLIPEVRENEKLLVKLKKVRS